MIPQMILALFGKKPELPKPHVPVQASEVNQVIDRSVRSE